MWHVRAAAHPGSGQIASMPRDGDVTNVALHGLVLTVTGRVPPPLRRCGSHEDVCGLRWIHRQALEQRPSKYPMPSNPP